MMPVTIDASLCNSDGHCVRDCPASILIINEKGQAPVVNPKKAKFCINCGHCASVCPTNAITLSAFADQQPIPYTTENIADYASVESFFKSRRSVRQFKKKPLTIDEIGELIHLSAYAPSGHNAQPVSWTVLNQPEKVQELAALVIDWMAGMSITNPDMAEKMSLAAIVNAFKNGADIICRSAPAVAASWAPTVGITPDLDAIIAATHLELAAHAKGLGACWGGYVLLAAKFSEPIRTFLGVPEDHSLHGVMLLGHPSVKYSNAPPRHKAVAEKAGEGYVFPARENEH
ncbi:nitroreductase family protein [Maridesulfovibrio frigidus]|uniref:nitroreductase family protein n=1 Tax=Maridesulfovibrio frigidus TaxID=340956 RepID=UPI0006894D31|nr:nitroreductase family protein [Maridesulfovibrio frigidus]